MSDQFIKHPPAVPHMLGFKIVETGYAVSYDFIRVYVWSCKKNRGPRSRGIGASWMELSQTIDRKGYAYVDFKSGGTKSRRYIHQLVLLVFEGRCPDGCEVCHGVAGKRCNLPSNLRYGTRSSNHHDKIRDGTDNRGEKNPQSKLTRKDIADVLSMSEAGHVQRVIASKFQIAQQTVSEIVTGKIWSHINTLKRKDEED